jgi:hypothetical protein
MARRASWLCVACLAGGLRAAAAEFPASLPPADDPDAAHDLALAASCIERGQEAAAVTHLSRYVADHPDRVHVRAYLAELLWRRERFAEAGAEFGRFVRDAQLAQVEPARLVHAHTRLLAIAGRCGDEYGEHVNRGIGLYLLARQAEPGDPKSAEGLYCKAAGELTLAGHARPHAARPHWYLHLVWSRLGQTRPAERSLQEAAARTLLTDLTPAEQGDLALASAPAISIR